MKGALGSIITSAGVDHGLACGKPSRIAGIARDRNGIARDGKTPQPGAAALQRFCFGKRLRAKSWFSDCGDSVAIPRDPGDSAWFSTSQAMVNSGTRYNRT